MWKFILLIICLVLLCIFFYVQGKLHEKSMTFESFANEMIIDNVGKYPEDIDKGIVTSEDKKKSSCDWCQHNVEEKQYSQSQFESVNTKEKKHSEKEKHKPLEFDFDGDNNDEEEDYGDEEDFGNTLLPSSKDLNEEEHIKENKIIDPFSNYKHSKKHIIDQEENETSQEILINRERQKQFNYSQKDKKNKQSLTEEDIKPKTTKSKKEENKWFDEPDPSILAPYGFVYIPNTLWSVPQQRPPVCITDSKCQAQPLYIGEKYADISEYTGVGTILPNFQYKETPSKLHPDKQKFLQELSKKKRYNPHYFYPGWYGYDKGDMSDVNTEL